MTKENKKKGDTSGGGSSSTKRKLRKLVRSPRLFFRDYAAKRAAKLRGIISRPMNRPRPGSISAERRYSVVSAVYNVEEYLDEYFKSLINQTLDFVSGIELIIVDDGSTDRSSQIIRRWQSRYPKNIKYIRKDNGGQASARNLGIEHATGAWITFMDPDDFVSRNYFAEVDSWLSASKLKPAMVSCNFVFYHESRREASDTHPLKYRFAKGNVTVDFDKPTKHMQLSAASAFFETALLHADPTLRLDERIRPNFEDAHFVNCYLAASKNKYVAFLSSATYFYRKRSAGTSTLDGAWSDFGTYGDVLEYGVLDMLRRHTEGNCTAVYAQRVALYHLIWYFKRIIPAPNAVSFLDIPQKERFWELLDRIFYLIDRQTILDFELGGTWLLHRVGLLSCFGKEAAEYQNVYLEELDIAQGMLQIRYFTAKVGFEAFLVGGRDAVPIATTIREHTFVDRSFVLERIVWIPLPKRGSLKVVLDKLKVHLVLGGKRQENVDAGDLYLHFHRKKNKVAAPFSLGVKLIRQLARTHLVKKHYDGAWALMDRDVNADDNAEHLYRYLRARTDVKAYFILRRGSHDWKRLRESGFKLVPFGSIRHRLLMLNCANYVSSHVDAYVTNFMDPCYYGDMLNYRYTFLQHGVIKDDLSNWLNSKRIDCFITAARREAESICGFSRYKFSSREVALTGLPRHDGLLQNDASSEPVLLVMPTWRQNLAGPPVGRGNRRRLNPDFCATEYFKQWNGFLSSDELAELVLGAGYRVVFMPHPNIAPYLNLFRLPDHVEVYEQESGESMQTLFRRSRILITDYSSVAFEMAWLNKPVVYFQFDAQSVFGGGHIYEPGYYSYLEDGFGPVCEDRASVLTGIREIFNNDGCMADKYAIRASKFFAYHDGDNSKRVFEAINDINRPAHQRPFDLQNLASQARLATDGGHWSIAESRWQKLAGSESEATLFLAQAKRKLGKLEEALALVGQQAAYGGVAWKAEHGEILFAMKAWSEAASVWLKLSMSMEEEHSVGVHALLRCIACYLQLGEVRAAAGLLARLPENEQNLPLCFEARACAAAAVSDWKAAAVHWAAISDADIQRMPAHSRLLAGWTYYHTGHALLVLKLIPALLVEHHRQEEVNYLAGLAALDLSDNKRLMAYWELPTHTTVGNVEFSLYPWLQVQDYIALAAAWRSVSNHDVALEILALAERSGRSPEVFMARAECLNEAGRWMDLVELSEKLSDQKLEPAVLIEFLKLKGNAMAQLGNIQSAMAAYGLALEIEPNSAALHGKLSDLAYQEMDFERAIQHGMKAYDLHRLVLSKAGMGMRLPPALLVNTINALQARGRTAEAAALLYREAAHLKLTETLAQPEVDAEALFQCAQWMSRVSIDYMSFEAQSEHLTQTTDMLGSSFSMAQAH